MWRSRFPDLSKVETFDLRISAGKKSYFFALTRKGWVLGPCGPNDHITVGLREDGEESELVQVHRKVNGQEVWRYSQDSMLKELKDYWDTHSEKIDQRVLSQPQTYLVSLHRLNLLYELFMDVIGVGYELFGRYFANLRVTKVNDRTVLVDLDVNPNRILHFMNSLKSPLYFLSRILSSRSPSVYLAVGKRLSRIILINPRKPRELDEDIGILLSKERMGIVVSNEHRRLSYLSGSALLELYQRIESGLPFGKLDKILEGSPPKLSLMVKIPAES